jgi:hypothetical protein
MRPVGRLVYVDIGQAMVLRPVGVWVCRRECRACGSYAILLEKEERERNETLTTKNSVYERNADES